MTRLFADTFYWVALTDNRDSAHSRAKRISQSFSSVSLLTTHAVLTEYLNYFAGWGADLRLLAISNVRRILVGASVQVLPEKLETFHLGLDLYSLRPDKGYSLTDCISMVEMRSQGVTEILTNDRHFEQEGFRILLRAEPA